MQYDHHAVALVGRGILPMITTLNVSQVTAKNTCTRMPLTSTHVNNYTDGTVRRNST